MSEPPRQPMFMGRVYRLDAEYTEDAASLEAAGWRLIATQRAPDGSITAQYAFGTLNELLPDALYPQAPAQPFFPGDPAPQTQRRYTRLAFRLALGFPVLMALLCVSVVVVSVGFNAHRSPAACAINSASCPASSDDQTPICVTAAPTTTPLAANSTGVTLGGMYDAFSALFGCEGASGMWYDVNFHGQIVNIEIGGSQDTNQSGLVSSDGLDRVFYIAVYWEHYPVPSLATRRGAIAHFFPPHSVALGAKTKVSLTEYLYRSAPLAAMFSASAFVNSVYQPVAPGTFSEVCDSAACAIQIGDWDEV